MADSFVAAPAVQRVAVAAVANKLARTIWAVLARGQAWRPEAWQAVH